MFKFDFAIDDVDVDPELSSQLSSIQIGGEEAKNDSPEDEEHDAGFTELTVDQLLGHLPHVISYSPLVVPILSDQKDLQQVTLARRDLFDARFQLIAQEEAPTSSNSALQAEGVVQPGPSALAFVEAPSDLVPGVYEGGLKTWECALDLAGHLAAERLSARGKRVLEVLCFPDPQLHLD
ncbi:hypothetical protein H0H81_004086 [Sphagnurus paluster]|uniref:Uncharacterized protein n=1 Tax=Sphagnurus paluster TaxID=117069 RepID=A0A9P7FNK6_9AGAR|nr:hypothetical protein H0H81_004086 [Sphagnurus paluster]